MLSMHAGSGSAGSGGADVGGQAGWRRLPIAGQQIGEVVLVGSLRQAGEHVGERGLEVVADAQGVLDQV